MYEREIRAVRCLDCVPEIPSLRNNADPATSGALAPSSNGSVQRPLSSLEVSVGVAGGSARREHERRSDARQTRIRDAHPHLGSLILALSDDPQSTKAWSVGAEGEERLGHRLDGLVGESVRVLHDRRIPRTRANIDHIVISTAGIFVIDAKKYTGRPRLRVDGGLIRPRTETLMVGTRDRTRLVDGIRGQIDVVESALPPTGSAPVPIRGMLCFVDAEWPIFGGDFTIQGVQVLCPKKAAQHIVMPGTLSTDSVEMIFRSLAAALPPA